MTTTIDASLLQKKMMGCWLGKAVGGTLGMPYEGVRHTLGLTFYDPVPTEMLPNDDLDAQVVYAFLLGRMETPRVDRHVLTESWRHVGMSPDEYGICKRNLKLGLRPPATGSYDNPFTQGMGAAIRTEIWACLAPGDPALAAAYAYEDACMDHAGEGIHAAMFIAALESMAFVESDRDTLLDAAVHHLPGDSLVGRAIADTRAWWAETGDWHDVQQRLAQRYVVDNFTDVVINLASIVLGWLAGDGKFGPSICAAVNAGQDTDCTGATLGALLGILDPDGIEPRWLEPIGRDLVLSPSIRGVEHPPTLDAFTDQVLDLRDRLGGRPPRVEDPPQDTAHLAVRAQLAWLEPGDLPRGDAPPAMPDDAEWVALPGLMAEIGAQRHGGKVALVRYRLNFPESGRFKLLFNSPEPMRAWFDGKPALSRRGGDFVPTMHRAPKDQITQLEVDAGPHTVTAAMKCPDDGRPLRWCVGIGETASGTVCDNWVTGVFERGGERRV